MKNTFDLKNLLEAAQDIKDFLDSDNVTVSEARLALWVIETSAKSIREDMLTAEANALAGAI